MQHLVELLRIKFQVGGLLFLVRLSVLQADLVHEQLLFQIVLMMKVGNVLLGHLPVDHLDLALQDLVHVADGEGGKGNLGNGDGVGVDGDDEGAGEVPEQCRGDEADPGRPGADDKDHPVGVFKPVCGMVVTPKLEAVDRSALEILLRDPCHVQGGLGSLLHLGRTSAMEIAVVVVIPGELGNKVAFELNFSAHALQPLLTLERMVSTSKIPGGGIGSELALSGLIMAISPMPC